jgi:hypothetical protein
MRMQTAPFRARAARTPPRRERVVDLIRWSQAHPAVGGALALACYLVIWVATRTFPLLTHPDQPQLDQASMDPNFYVWCLSWWPYAITHGINPLYTNQIGAPGGYNLAWATTIPPLAVLVWPITLLAGPVTAFGLLVMTAIPVSGWAAFLLCRRLTGRFWASLAGGAVYGFSAYEMNHITAGQLNLSFAPLLPLLAYLVLLWRDGRIGSRWFTVLLGLGLAVQYYLFTETLADLTLLTVVGLGIGYLLADSSGRRFIFRLARCTGIAYLLAIALAVPDLIYMLTHTPPGFVRDPSVNGVTFANLVVPRVGQDFGIGWLTQHAAIPGPGADGYIGIPLLVLTVLWAIRTWSARLTKFLVAMLGLCLICAIGPVLRGVGPWRLTLPWARLWYLPVARSAFPVRFMVFAFLGLAVITALWLASPSARTWPRWLLGVVALAAIGANTPALSFAAVPGTPAFITAGTDKQALHHGDTVVVLSGRGNAGMLWQAEAGFHFRVAGGFINAAIDRRYGYPDAFSGLAVSPLTNTAEQSFWSYIASAGIKAIMVEQSWPQGWPAILDRLPLERQVSDGVLIYRPAP